ncbi:MAG: hypothetical protein WAL80_20255 [Xanthobacteraceae bacterium]
MDVRSRDFIRAVLSDRRPVTKQPAKTAETAHHPIAIGATVTVLTVTRAGLLSIEGIAEIRGHAQGRHRYLVRFIGDPVVRRRTVHHDYQPDPNHMLEMMLDIWRASNAPEFDEFFPDSPSE